jgi:hypothetical protein
MLKSTPKCNKLTLEVLKVNIFRFKMQNDPIWAYNQMAKKLSAPQKKAQNRPLACLGNYRVCPNSGNWNAWWLYSVELEELILRFRIIIICFFCSNIECVSSWICYQCLQKCCKLCPTPSPTCKSFLLFPALLKESALYHSSNVPGEQGWGLGWCRE